MFYSQRAQLHWREYCKWTWGIYAQYLQGLKQHNFISRRDLGLTDILIIMNNQKQKPKLLMTMEYLLNWSKHRFGCQVLIRRPIWCQIAIIFTLHVTNYYQPLLSGNHNSNQSQVPLISTKIKVHIYACQNASIIQISKRENHKSK